MQIPQQLNSQRFLKTKEKVPVEQQWTTVNNYPIESFHTPNKSYGVLTGTLGLVVVDCDKEYIQTKFLEQYDEFRNTFTVKTASKKLNHFYFRCTDTTDPKSFSIDNDRGERVVDVQGKGKMVIGPNSQLESGNVYEVINDSDIREITYTHLKNLIINIDNNLSILEKDNQPSKPVFFDFDDVCVRVKEKITVKDVLMHFGVDTTSTPCMCPLGHTSEGGKCFSFNKDVWNCFHCHQSGNIFQLYQKMAKCTFVEAKNRLAIKAGISQEKTAQILQYYADSETKHLASEMLADEFVKTYNAYTIRNDDIVEIYIYNEGIYIPNGKSYIREYVRSIIGNYYKESFVKTVIDKIAVDTYIEQNRFFVDEPCNLIPVANGILDIDTGELIDYTPKLKFFTKLPVVYDPIIKAEKTEQFVKDITNNQEDFLTIQEIAGYLLYRENKFEKAIMLLGSGRNGKSKMIELLEKMIGKENSVNISLKMLEQDSFAICSFKDKYANFSPDLSKEALTDTGNFKSLVGRDMITANRKFLTRIMFKSYAKMIFATNDLPITKDISDGFWDRWVMIDFPFKFEDPPTEPHHKLKDPEIIAKITTPKEMSGFLNWSLEGLARLLKNKKFTKDMKTSEIKMKWITASSTFARFWFDEIDMTGNINDQVRLDDLYNAYEEFCTRHGIEKESTQNRRHAMDKQFQCIVKKIWQNQAFLYVVKKIKFKHYTPVQEDTVEVQSF